MAESESESQEPKIYPGGELPDVGTLMTESFQDFVDNIGPYALAGLGYMLFLVPLVFITVIVTYMAMGVGMVGMIAAMLGLAAALPEDLAPFGAIVGQLGGFCCMFVLIFAVTGAMLAIMAPVNASLARAVAAHQRGVQELQFNAAFSTVTQDVVPLVMASAVLALAGIVGAMFCYVPALLVPLFLGFVTTMIALHRASPGDAFRANASHVVAHFGWHIPYFLLYFAVLMVANYVPVLGPMFILCFQVRAYRALFGDGDEMVLDVPEPA